MNSKHITPDRSFIAFPFRDVMKYRDLIFLHARKNIVVTIRQTALGSAWLFLSPLAASLIQLFVFGYLAGFETGGAPGIVFYLFSNTAWNVYSSTVNSDSQIFFGNVYLFGKVHFPKLVISYSNMLSSAFVTGIQFLLAAGFLVFYAVRGMAKISPAILLIVVPLFLMMLLGQGMGLIYASLTVRYRDLMRIFPLITRFLMYASPVVYPLSQLSGRPFAPFLLLNPLCPQLELLRAMAWGAPFPPVWSVTLSAALIIGINLFGILVFQQVSRTFIDYI